MFHLKQKSIMKTNKFFAMAAIVCGAAMSLTSCSENDNPVDDGKTTVTIGFEGAKLNDQGIWCGDETGVPFVNEYGAASYACAYTEQGISFPVNYTPSWGSWSGFGASNLTGTTFSMANYFTDQFNNITGKAKSGNNFCVIFPFNEKLEFDTPVTVKGFWYTNSAWAVDAILNGDGMSPGKFEADDWFKCILAPTPAKGMGGARYELFLAKDGDYVKDWQYCDLSDVDAFKNISSLLFSFDSTKKNAGGVTTPTYICIDDIVIEK